MKKAAKEYSWIIKYVAGPILWLVALWNQMRIILRHAYFEPHGVKGLALLHEIKVLERTYVYDCWGCVAAKYHRGHCAKHTTYL